MNNILKSVALATVAAVATATPGLARSNHSAHVALSQAVQRTGIQVYINSSICDERNTYGMYIPGHSAIVICQENRTRGDRTMVAWTEEDYDTLRHEVHHVVQDCVDNSFNGELNAVYVEPIEFGVSVLGKQRAIRIANVYAENGASNHIQVMEIEAFAVAAQNNPAEQIQDIHRYCL